MSNQADVLILGAGVIGLCTAIHLLESGRSVTVLDRTGPGAGASHGNCGTITPSHAQPLMMPGMIGKALRWMFTPDAPFRVVPWADSGLLPWMWRAALQCRADRVLASTAAKAGLLKATRAALPDFLARHAIECEFEPSGALYVMRDARSIDEERELPAALAEFGIPARLIDGTEVAAMEPALKPGVVGGLLFENDAQLRPESYLAGLAARVQSLGGRIESGVTVDALVSGEGRIQSVSSDRGAWLARDVVFALGAWSPRLARTLGLKLPIQPGKGYSITFSSPARRPLRPLVLLERSVCVTSWGSGFRLGSTMEFAGYDESLNRTRLDALKRAAREYLHEPHGDVVHEEWFGWRPMCADDVPLLGRSPKHSNLYLATGHGMLGVSMSVATGQLVSDLVCGRAPAIDPRPYRVERFA